LPEEKMNSRSFSQNVRLLVTSIILLTLLFPISLGTPLGLTPVKAAPPAPHVEHTPDGDVLNISGVANDGAPDYFTIRRMSNGDYSITTRNGDGITNIIQAILGPGGGSISTARPITIP
jgi:hypothetical protein